MKVLLLSGFFCDFGIQRQKFAKWLHCSLCLLKKFLITWLSPQWIVSRTFVPQVAALQNTTEVYVPIP